MMRAPGPKALTTKKRAIRSLAPSPRSRLIGQGISASNRVRRQVTGNGLRRAK